MLWKQVPGIRHFHISMKPPCFPFQHTSLYSSSVTLPFGLHKDIIWKLSLWSDSVVRWAVNDVSKDPVPLKHQEPLSQIAQGHLPEDGSLQQYRFENLKSCTIICVGNQQFLLVFFEQRRLEGNNTIGTEWEELSAVIPVILGTSFHGLSIGNI